MYAIDPVHAQIAVAILGKSAIINTMLNVFFIKKAK